MPALNKSGPDRSVLLATRPADWREDNAALNARIEAAREELRQKALQTIKDAATARDWKAAAKALELVFPEYRQSSKVEVSATASTGNIIAQITPEQIAELQELRRRALEIRNKQRNPASGD